MARDISQALRRALYAQETGEVLHALVEISHPSIVGGPIRVVADMHNFVCNGNTYTAFPFQITLPQDDEQGLATLRLVLDNVDRTIMAAIRAIPPSVPPQVSVSLVLDSQPNVVDLTFPELSLTSVTYDAFTVEGQLALDADDREPFPADVFSPQLFPQLF